MTRNGRLSGLLLVLTVGAWGACKDLSAPDFNNPGIDDLQENPTRSAVISAATGLVIGARDNIAEFNGYVSLLGILGRESYNLDGADTRFIVQMLGRDGTQLDPGARALGGNLWVLRYRNIRNANVLLNALDGLPDVPPDGMTPEEKEATRGFAKTIQALDFLLVINTRNDNGAPIDVGRPIDAPPAPIESRDAVFDHVVDLLNQAVVHLDAGGAAFPFPLSAGFAGFDTPPTFREVNQALLARVQVYRMKLDGQPLDPTLADSAIAALGGSFLDPTASSLTALDVGAYHVFGAGSGDRTSGLVDPDLYAHTSIRTDAQLQADGVTPDARFVRKVTSEGVDPRTLLESSSAIQFKLLYPSAVSPVAIIRNEELILLRAEAELGRGNAAVALDDINLIRQVSGGLDPIDPVTWAAMTPDEQLNELLYNKRYSLAFEGGHRWIDWRRYDKLDEIQLDAARCPAPSPCHSMHDQFPIPRDEILARP